MKAGSTATSSGDATVENDVTACGFVDWSLLRRFVELLAVRARCSEVTLTRFRPEIRRLGRLALNASATRSYKTNGSNHRNKTKNWH